MSRFYKAPEVQFREDYLYQPPWEMLMGALSKKENEIQQDANTLELYKSLELLHADKDPEKAYVNEIYKELEDEASKIATNMQKNFLDPAYKTQMQALRDKTRNRFRSGDIRRLQETAEGVEAFEADLMANVTDPERRKIYRERLQNPYFEAGGSKGNESPFKYEDGFYDNRNFLEEYSASEIAKSVGEDVIGTAYANLSVDDDGDFILSGTNTRAFLAKEKLEQAVEGFLKGENLEGYIKHDEDYFDKQWYDENGEMNFDKKGTVPYEIMQGALSQIYSRTSATRSRVQNQVKATKISRELEAKRAVREAYDAATDSDASAYYLTDMGKQVEEARIVAVEAFASQYNVPQGEEQEFFDRVLEFPENYTDNMVKQATDISAQYNAAKRAGVKQFADLGYSAEETKAIAAAYKSDALVQNLLSKPGYFFVTGSDGRQISFQENIPTGEFDADENEIMRRAPRPISLYELQKPGKVVNLPGVGRKTILGVEPLTNTAEFVPGMDVDVNKKPIPGSKVILKVYYDPKEGGESGNSGINPGTTDEKGTFVRAEYYVPGDVTRTSLTNPLN